MGMTATCPSEGCGYVARSSNHRGARLGNCPDCGTPLRAHTAGRSKGRYLCPVSGAVTTLGLRGIQLDGPHVLEWVPGTQPWFGYLPEPRHDFEKVILSGALGKVFGPGCVVSDWFTPGREGPGLRLIPVPAEDADPAAWIVNEPLAYRKCAACSSRVPVTGQSLMTEAWTPKRDHYWAGPRRNRRPVDTVRGPHPPGTVACHDCRDGEEEPF